MVRYLWIKTSSAKPTALAQFSVRNFPIIVVTTLMTYAGHTLAQEIVTQDLGTKLQEQQQQDILQRNLAPPAIPLPSDTLPESVTQMSCVNVKSISLDGVSLLSATDQQRVVDPYLNRCLSKNDINQLLQAINQAYINKGYITTRAYLPAQSVSQGQFRLQVIEGKIASISLNNNQRASDKRRLAHAFPTSPLNYFKLQDVEQGLDQINRAPSAQGKIALEPSDEVGQTRVVVNTSDEKTWRVRVGVDNQGEKSVGRTRFQFALDKDNLLEINDVWTLSAIRTEDSRALSVTGLIPYQYWTALLSYSQSAYDVPIVSNINLGGQGRSSLLGIERIMYRDKTEQWSWMAQLITKDNERDINNIALAPDTLSLFKVGGRWLYRSPKRQAYIESVFVKGLTAFDAVKDNLNLPNAAPHHQFNKLEINGLLRQSLANNWIWLSQAKGQYSRVGLVGSEQLAVGGEDTVRGFSSSVTQADQGFYWRNQLSHACLTQWLMQTNCIAFMDAAISKNLSTPSTQLIGAGLGFQYEYKAINASLSLGFPLYDDALSTDSASLNFKVLLNY